MTKRGNGWKGGRRTHSYGYVMLFLPEHPRASHGYVPEHVVIAERALGKPLPDAAQVHHVNGKRDDNRPENLVICEDQAYHRLLHTRMEAYRATGDPKKRKCVLCKEWDDTDAMTPWTRKGNGRHVHRACAAAYQRELKARRRLENSLTLTQEA